MRTSNKFKSLFSLTLVYIVILAVMFTAMPVCFAYATTEDNLAGVTIDFPTATSPDNSMINNYGTIGKFYSTGILTNNYGTIVESSGTLSFNHEKIELLNAGHVGTNYKTIDKITNTGSLGENSEGAEVGYNSIGNVITRNDGTVILNYGTISENYSAVNTNGGTVYMYDGSVTDNVVGGTVYYGTKTVSGESIPSKGTITSNAGNIVITGGTATVGTNTGSITVTNGNAVVTTNSGTITLGENATLTCTTNNGAINRQSESARADVSNGEPAIGPLYKIVFVGDDGTAQVQECTVKGSDNYTEKDEVVFFTLPEGYGCAEASVFSLEPSRLYVNAYIEDGATEFIITCHKCSGTEYYHDDDYHWQICTTEGCEKICNKVAHTFGEYVSDNNATCINDGTKTRICTICDYKQTVTDVDSHLTSTNHMHIVTDPEVAPTQSYTGLTAGSHCEDCKKTIVAQEIIPKLAHTCYSFAADYKKDATNHWKECDSCGSVIYFGAHIFTEYTSNNDSTCITDGTKTRTCTVCGYNETVVDKDSHLSSTKHIIVTDPGVEATEEHTGLTEGSHCKDCGKVFKAQDIIPQVAPQSENSEDDSSEDNPGAIEENPVESNPVEDDTPEKDTRDENTDKENDVNESAADDNTVGENTTDDNTADENTSDENSSNEDSVNDDSVSEDIVSEDTVGEDATDDDLSETDDAIQSTVDQNASDENETADNKSSDNKPADDKVEEDTTSENASDATEQSDTGTSETTGDEIITDTADTEETEKSEETVPDTKETGKAEPVLDNTGSSEDVTEEKASVPTAVWIIGSCALVGAGAFFGFNLYKRKMTGKS